MPLVAAFEGTSLKRRLWALYGIWQGGGPKPSRQLGITYPWVAVDLDTAAHALGKHVEAEVDKRRRAEEKAINNEPAISVGKKGKGRAARKYRQLPDERRREIWFEVVARIVDEKVVLHDAPPKGETGRWRWEKPITGDSQLDQQQHKGARTVYDAEGRRRAEFDASGKRTYLWNPG